MDVLPYDEGELIRSLDALPRARRAIFAAACAERLRPAYVAHCGDPADPNAVELGALLDGLWNRLRSPDDTDGGHEQRIERCFALIPSEDAEGDGAAYAEDASAALAYALECQWKGESQAAAWAARRAYDALDSWVMSRTEIDINEPGAELYVLSDPLIQTELARQRRDLADLASASDTSRVAARLEERARRDAPHTFG